MMSPSNSRRVKGLWKRIPGQRIVKCAHCGARKNFLSTWVAVHEGRVCYTCIQSGHIKVVPDSELEVAQRRLQEELGTCANRLDIAFWQSEVIRLGGTF
jgi:hypothetical protein